MGRKPKVTDAMLAPAELEQSGPVFDRARRLASALFGADETHAGIVLVSEGADRRLHPLQSLPRTSPGARWVVRHGEVLWVEDASCDPLFDGYSAAGGPAVGFYVAAPIRLDNGSIPGVLAVGGVEPRRYDADLAGHLQDLADFVADEWTRVRATRARDAAHSALASVVHDISRSEQRLKLAVETAKLYVWELDYVERSMCKVGSEQDFFDVPQTYDEVIADPWAIVDVRDRPAVIGAWKLFLKDGTPFLPEFRIQRRDGKEIWVASASSLTFGENGEPVRFVGALQDVTKRKAQERALIQAKEEAEAANRAKSGFLATVSHEIRTPLNGMLGMAQAMGAGPLEPVQSERLKIIRQSGEGLLAILNEVLDLSKIEAGKLTLEDGEFDIAELAQAAWSTFQAVAENKGLAFELRVLPGARGAYRGDPMRVRQILYNLIANALKFTDRGEVAILVGRRDGALRLQVRDSGIGMTAEQRKHLFQAFEQAEASTTRRYGGTGLGLSICRELAELMRGRIRVTSAPGRGSSFTVSLPLPKIEARPRAAQAPAETTSPAAIDGPLRVLAAEDNSVNQLVLKTLLNQVGVDPMMVGDGRAAIEAWEREPWDLILMDVQMPLLDGPAATMEIRTREAVSGRPRTPIVALTANAMPDQVAKYRAAGMDGFVAKPIAASRLFAALQAVLDGGAQPEAEAAA